MKKTYNLNDLDCAVCAAKMEDAVKKIEGVNSVAISYITQKLTIDANDENFDKIMDNVVKCCKKIEPDCEIVK